MRGCLFRAICNAPPRRDLRARSPAPVLESPTVSGSGVRAMRVIGDFISAACPIQGAEMREQQRKIDNVAYLSFSNSRVNVSFTCSGTLELVS